MSKWQISRLEVRDNPENGAEPLVETIEVETIEVETFDGEAEAARARVEELHLETSYEHVATPVGRKASGDPVSSTPNDPAVVEDLPPVEEV